MYKGIVGLEGGRDWLMTSHTITDVFRSIERVLALSTLFSLH
jgi:hypothetical protein